MSLELTLAQLQNDAHALALFYSKDFGTHLTGIQASLEIYLHEPNQTRKTSIQTDLELINHLYQTNHFCSLNSKNDPRYAPLIIINDLLPDLNTKINLFFQHSTQQTYERVFQTCYVIHSVGYLYRKSFHQALEKVHAHPQGHDFTIPLIGITGKVWQYR